MVLRSGTFTFYLYGLLLTSSWAKPSLHFGICRGRERGKCRPSEECLEQDGFIQASDSFHECFHMVCCLRKQTAYSQSTGDYCKNNLEPHIANGEAAEIREFPWMAMLLYGDRLLPKCGGSLVGSKWILTAAHCVPRESSEEQLRRARLGVWNVQQTEDCQGLQCTPPPQDFAIEQAIVHEMYRPSESAGTNLQRHSNDIALLLLGRNVTYSAFVQPICLPSAYDRSRRKFYADYSLTIAGWGRTSDLSVATSPVKIKAQVSAWSTDSCKKLYPDLSRGQMCAGGGSSKRSSCFGDSGGPVMDDNQLVGIISLGASKCGSDRRPMVVTRVDAFMKWLAQQMNLSLGNHLYNR
ncbi:CLIP domain-containing serine protease 2-like [Drosophila ficusphila]|uniref:CLIP domain-containing serine protease 2-like n=1 Tax=Drosophila ficusphila TaxID=30025 RepID=UPI0007E75AE8|nr:CLIP domain-containing serine protease 2-like [Drosophila ficusphila]